MKYFIIGNSGVGKTTLFHRLQKDQELKDIGFTFHEDKSFNVNLETFTNLNTVKQQEEMIKYLDCRDKADIGIFDDSLLSTLIWNNALRKCNEITKDEFYRLQLSTMKLMREVSKETMFIVLKKPKLLIKNNIDDRNRDIEILESKFTKIYDVYIDIWYKYICIYLRHFKIKHKVLYSRRNLNQWMEQVKEILRKGGV